MAIEVVSSHLEELFSTYPQVNTVGSIPVLRMQLPPGMSDVDYPATQQIMKEVIKAGPRAGVDRFIEEDPAIARFYHARTTAHAIKMLLSPTPADADPIKWAINVMNTEAARSVVARGVLVPSLLTACGKDLLQQDPQDLPELKLLSIASGIGQCPLEVISELHQTAPGRISGLLVDSDQTAIVESRKLAEEKGLNGQVKAYPKNFFRWKDPPSGIHLIESTGFTDYCNDRTTFRLFQMCRKLVSENGVVGVVIVTNIVSDREPFLDIIWGKMYRRTPGKLAELAEAAGFAAKRTVLILDPTETMCTIVARP